MNVPNLKMSIRKIRPFSESQLNAVSELKKWLNDVSQVNLQPFRRAHFQQFSPRDVFVGYHDDAPASIVLRLSKEEDSTTESVIEKVINLVKAWITANSFKN